MRQLDTSGSSVSYRSVKVQGSSMISRKILSHRGDYLLCVSMEHFILNLNLNELQIKNLLYDGINEISHLFAGALQWWNVHTRCFLTDLYKWSLRYHLFLVPFVCQIAPHTPLALIYG